MPITPLHFGPALAVRELVGHKRFGILAFTVTQVLMDAEPIIRVVFDLDGKLHETTHNPTFGVIYALIAIAACWRWEKWSAVVGAVFGSVTHLWLDAMYHADVAEKMARWVHYSPDGGTTAELVCYLGFFFWLLFAGIRKAVKDRRERRVGGLPG